MYFFDNFQLLDDNRQGALFFQICQSHVIYGGSNFDPF